MTDWRSEPPDSAGWWIYRRDREPRMVAVEMVERGHELTARVSTADGRAYLVPFFGAGQWLKVPE